MGTLLLCGVVSPSKNLHATSSLSRHITNYYPWVNPWWTTHNSRKDNDIKWLSRQAGNIKRILCSEWLPKRARWASSSRSGFHGLVPQEWFSFGDIINLLLAELAATRWLNAGLVIFCIFIDLDSVLVNMIRQASLYVSGKLPTYPSPKLTLSLLT